MNFNKNMFEIALLKRHKSKKDIAILLKISLPTLYRKMNGDSDFYREEIQKIQTYLNLTINEREEIFFA